MEALNQIIVTSLKEIMVVPSHRGRYLEMNKRENYGLSFCIDGQITYRHKGQAYVSNRDHAVLLPQGESYLLFGDETGHFPLINFTCTGFSCDRFLQIPLHNPESYLRDMTRLQDLSLFRQDPARALSVFYDILSRLSAETGQEPGLLDPAVEYLEAHYTDPQLTNGQLARQAGISEVYFRRLFSQRFGVTPKQYVLDIRIHRAKQLLANSLSTVTAISEQCGFSSVYHFCRAFKEKTGLTPTEFAKQARRVGL